MTSLKGITVKLYERVYASDDDFGNPVYTEAAVTVDNVLAAPVSVSDMTNASPAELLGRKAVYQIAVPKGDSHSWENNRVEFFGHMWQVIGPAEEGIEEMLPLAWNRKFRVECIDGC